MKQVIRNHGRAQRIGGPDPIPPGKWHTAGDAGEPSLENDWSGRLRWRRTNENQTEFDGIVEGGESGSVVVTVSYLFRPTVDAEAPGVGGYWTFNTDGELIFTAADDAGGPGSDTSAIHTGDAAGGVLSGTYPDPGFAVDMATQAELDAHITDATDAHDASAISIADAGSYYTSTTVEGALQEIGAGGIGGGGSGSFSLLTDGDLEEPELVFADGDVIVTTF